MKKVAGIAFDVISAGMLVFHVLVLAGVAPYEIVWGSMIKGRDQIFVPETIAVLLTAAFAFVESAASGLIPVKGKLWSVLAWCVFGYIALNVAGNLASPNMTEKILFTVIAAVQATLAFLIAFPRKTA